MFFMAVYLFEAFSSRSMFGLFPFTSDSYTNLEKSWTKFEEKPSVILAPNCQPDSGRW